MNPLIDTALVRELVAAQFPDLAGLPVRPVDRDGWDNRTFRLGDTRSVRLPSAAGYVPQVRKEIGCLPVLAAGLSLPIPRVVGVGRPGGGYPFDWTIREWIDGTPVSDADALDSSALAGDLADFLVQLRAIGTPGPPPGPHSAGRGAPLDQFDAEIARTLPTLAGRIDTSRAAELWARARASRSGPPVWFHGDVAAGNLLTKAGRLSAVIDFGCCGFGDPACDLVPAWTMFGPADRAEFRRRLAPDDGEWARGIGWALWKAVISVDDPRGAATARHTLDQLECLTSAT
jgi:aminoglycoside phosphotransferase (APT) family kinase protein